MTKKKDNRLDREEYGYGYDISPDDLGVIGQNNEAKKQNDHENKGKPRTKENPEIINE